MTALPVQPAHELADRPEEQRWLIDGLWADEAVGIVGGEPKCCKSFLALDMAVAVASGTPCLRRYAVGRRGRVLLFPAEDPLHVVRRRLDGIARAAGVDLAAVDLQVITAPSLRLDRDDDRDRLEQTIASLEPTLLILDPFVRLHRIDENASGEVAPILAFLRDLQRRHHLAVVVVHHAKKGGAKARAGQALRGSSEFHAWGDSNLYLRRLDDRLMLSVEHRAAPSVAGVELELRAAGDALALEPVTQRAPPPAPRSATLEERIGEALMASTAPITLVGLREVCRVRTATLCEALGRLVDRGVVRKAGSGYELVAG